MMTSLDFRRQQLHMMWPHGVWTASFINALHFGQEYSSVIGSTVWKSYPEGAIVIEYWYFYKLESL